MKNIFFCRLREFWMDERGVETLEAVILMIAIIAIGFAFKNTLTNWFHGLLENIGRDIGDPVVKVNVGTFPGE